MTSETSRITLLDGCRLAYRLDGPEGAPVLVLANSLGTNLELWAPQLASFASRFRVLRYDMRGHGGSDVPPGAYSLDRLGRDVVELLDGLGISRAHFCGVSLGGMVGQWLGVQAPERLERLILANTAAYLGPPSGWQTRIRLVLTEGMEAITENLLQRWFTPSFLATGSPEVERLRVMLLGTPATGYAGCCAAIRDMDLRPMSGLIQVPTQVILGTQDPATPPAMAEALARAMPRPPKVVRLEAAHLSNIEQPDGFNRAVLGFLE